jgi:hypothetical protein
MSTGAWHYQRGEYLLEAAEQVHMDSPERPQLLAEAQAHFTAAVAAATALGSPEGMRRADRTAWLAAAGADYPAARCPEPDCGMTLALIAAGEVAHHGQRCAETGR